MKKIGIFGGTFDPVHHAHLILARDGVEQLGLDSVIFIPAATSPHKLGQTATSAEIRLELLRAAIEGESRFCLDTVELDRPPPSYTIDTVELIRKREPDAKLYCLIGGDNVARLETWHRFPELAQLVQFVILDRTGLSTPHPYRAIHRPLEIAATDIRNRVALGQSIRYLVPPAVEKIIRERQLYRES